MAAQRRIPRELPVRALTSSEIEEITAVVFTPSQPCRSDLLMVFGAPASSGRWEPAAELLGQGLAPRALVTGGAPYRDGSRGSEAQGVKTALVSAGIPESGILVEERSTNTLENVLFTIKLLNEIGATPRSLMFYCKAHHSGRVRRTLSKYLPEVVLSCATYDAVYEGASVSVTNWTESEIAVRRVLAEYARIRVYADRGDIDR
ncbi:MAG: YdcF family protein [Ramlibacter sp.]